MIEERLAAVIAGELTGSARSETAVNDIAFALDLNLHQPAGNLDDLLRTDPWAAAEILHAIDRIPRSLWPYEGTGGVQLSLSRDVTRGPHRSRLPATRLRHRRLRLAAAEAATQSILKGSK